MHYPRLSRFASHGNRAAFTLVELLVVVGIMVVMMALVGPAFMSIGSGKNFTKAVYDMGGYLDGARTYAVANHTYVYVGFAETDASKSASAKPQVSGTGRVAMAAVASRDGTRPYSLADVVKTWTSSYGGTGGNLIAIGKLVVFENLHLADLPPPPATGPMARPTVKPTWRVAVSVPLQGYPPFKSLTPFSWPLGTTLGSGQYYFEKVIEYNPQGTPLLVYENNSKLNTWLVAELQPSHGNAAPAQPASPSVGNQAGVLINGLTGGTRVFRP
ncbi:MAG: hypothetical protein QOD99_148 [Chthoniobacter sp.]|jgi:type II secretory pathway pseudopilin PulG|nr:hypothetical protein [Chthoniobacter sp.]